MGVPGLVIHNKNGMKVYSCDKSINDILGLGIAQYRIIKLLIFVISGQNICKKTVI